ncbi:MAG: hypothetical protein PHC64_01025 [Candidatus Gastranaerophilales bacterium]|nr:hypothetical protein [Candidatus Gastranaerophilales bacterium]
MKLKERREFIRKELQAIYDEFNICINQMIMLKPFIKDLIDVTEGAQPTYDLVGFIQKDKI